MLLPESQKSYRGTPSGTKNAVFLVGLMDSRPFLSLVLADKDQQRHAFLENFCFKQRGHRCPMVIVMLQDHSNFRPFSNVENYIQPLNLSSHESH